MFVFKVKKLKLFMLQTAGVECLCGMFFQSAVKFEPHISHWVWIFAISCFLPYFSFFFCSFSAPAVLCWAPNLRQEEATRVINSSNKRTFSDFRKQFSFTIIWQKYLSIRFAKFQNKITKFSRKYFRLNSSIKKQLLLGNYFFRPKKTNCFWTHVIRD